MSGGPTVYMTGLEDVVKNIKRVDDIYARKILRPSVFAALKPIQAQAKRNAKWASIRKLISRRAHINKIKDVKGKVYLRRDLIKTPDGEKVDRRMVKVDGRNVGMEVVGNILEFGHPAMWQPMPFMRPARDQAAGQAKIVLETELRKRMKAL